MKVSKEDLVAILQKVNIAIPAGKFITQNSCFVFTGKEVIAYNDRISVASDFKTDFSCMVPAEEFISMIQKVRTKKIEMTFDKKENQLVLQCNKVTSRFSILEYEAKNFETLPDKKVKWKKLPSNFHEGVLLTTFSCSTDMTKPYLTCISIEKERVISSDNLRISIYKWKEKMQDDFLLPISSAVKLLKFDVDEYFLTDGWVMFRGEDNIIFYSRIMDVVYPEVTKFFNAFDKVKWFTLPKELKESIELSELFTDGTYDFDKRIEIEFKKKKKIICRGKKETGSIECEIDAPMSIDAKIFVNPVFFKEAFDHAMKVAYHKNLLFFKSESFKHLMLLYTDKE